MTFHPGSFQNVLEKILLIFTLINSRSKTGEELAQIIQTAPQPAEKLRKTRANSRTESVPSSTRATRQTRNMRSKKAVVVSPEQKVSVIKNLEKEMRSEPTKVENNTPQNNLKNHNFDSPMSISLVQDCSPSSFSVKNRVSAFEDLIKSVHSNTSPRIRSPALPSESVSEIPSQSPTVSTTDTSFAQLSPQKTSNNISTTIITTPKSSRKSSRASIRKSLKMLPSKSRLSGYTKGNLLLGLESLQDNTVLPSKDTSKEESMPIEKSNDVDSQEVGTCTFHLLMLYREDHSPMYFSLVGNIIY